jgi:cytochrome d ubiquinol oxidase subunit I
VTVLPFLMNTAGWALTENGRQPWIVQGLQLVKDAVSPSNSVTTIVISLSVFVLLYVVLAVVAVALMLHFARKELAPVPAAAEDEEPVLHFTY